MNKFSNKDLYLKALSFYVSNADKVIDEVWKDKDWSNVIIWEPFQYWEINDLDELISELYEVLIKVRQSKPQKHERV